MPAITHKGEWNTATTGYLHAIIWRLLHVITSVLPIVSIKQPDWRHYAGKYRFELDNLANHNSVDVQLTFASS